jgi:Sulfotransferase family
VSVENGGHTLAFVGGLHRSGTSLLHRCLAEHPLVSGFRGTGVPEDEGQHLQSVYPAASAHGGPGRFGFDPASHLTEDSPLVTDESRARLMDAWSPHWDMTRPVLVEKSPPNLVRGRFLQALFPESKLVMMMRHPIAVACATQKWAWTSYTSLVEHWVVCHETLLADAPHLRDCVILRYEDMVADPDGVLAVAFETIGVEPRPTGLQVRTGINDAYFGRFGARRWNPWKRHDTDRAVERFEDRVARFGYSLREPLRLSEPSDVAMMAILPGTRA